jgi:uncharacterized OsmC-like protein
MPASKVNIRELQIPIKARYQEEPQAATIRLRVTSSASDLADPLHCSVSPEAVPSVVWRSGAHPGVGGLGDVPCSGDVLLGALAACQEITVRMVAAAMGLSRDVPVGFKSITCRTRVGLKGEQNEDRAQRLLQNAERYCVVLNTLRGGVPVESQFTLEG